MVAVRIASTLFTAEYMNQKTEEKMNVVHMLSDETR